MHWWSIPPTRRFVDAVGGNKVNPPEDTIALKK